MILADGAGAVTLGFELAFSITKDRYTRLMCWAHVNQNVEKNIKVKNKEYHAAILFDIKSLQLSYDKNCFELYYNLFRAKCLSKKDSDVDSFLEYFHVTYVASGINLWYEGASGTNGIPSTTN